MPAGARDSRPLNIPPPIGWVCHITTRKMPLTGSASGKSKGGNARVGIATARVPPSRSLPCAHTSTHRAKPGNGCMTTIERFRIDCRGRTCVGPLHFAPAAKTRPARKTNARVVGRQAGLAKICRKTSALLPSFVEHARPVPVVESTTGLLQVADNKVRKPPGNAERVTPAGAREPGAVPTNS